MYLICRRDYESGSRLGPLSIFVQERLKLWHDLAFVVDNGYCFSSFTGASSSKSMTAWWFRHILYDDVLGFSDVTPIQNNFILLLPPPPILTLGNRMLIEIFRDLGKVLHIRHRSNSSFMHPIANSKLNDTLHFLRSRHKKLPSSNHELNVLRNIEETERLGAEVGHCVIEQQCSMRKEEVPMKTVRVGSFTSCGGNYSSTLGKDFPLLQLGRVVKDGKSAYEAAQFECEASGFAYDHSGSCSKEHPSMVEDGFVSVVNIENLRFGYGSQPDLEQFSVVPFQFQGLLVARIHMWAASMYAAKAKNRKRGRFPWVPLAMVGQPRPMEPHGNRSHYEHTLTAIGVKRE
ncbi:uncharacterized protein BDR25DRAFT_353088 [Lindgomyces ingoldianus]|uniref:Uncharacterized protein n=1 Tax=Lindgomyces ingoldianus TaxID=673940 RepID=A0ACB6R1Q9_9PLEO|nr:uncharacterized protein BDR25DRAFT_353088 [Lindgomyces ingoldianus]KAF2472763.1 hypothetical protein BDR25DRAFT_353088 [Lindgomyces ingoldianus]